jgi:hypothetical protein
MVESDGDEGQKVRAMNGAPIRSVLRPASWNPPSWATGTRQDGDLIEHSCCFGTVDTEYGDTFPVELVQFEWIERGPDLLQVAREAVQVRLLGALLTRAAFEELARFVDRARAALAALPADVS